MTDQKWITLDEIWEGITAKQIPFAVTTKDDDDVWYLCGKMPNGRYLVNFDGSGTSPVDGNQDCWRIHQEPKPKVKMYPALIRMHDSTRLLITYATEEDDLLACDDLIAWNPKGYPVIEIESSDD